MKISSRLVNSLGNRPRLVRLIFSLKLWEDRESQKKIVKRGSAGSAGAIFSVSKPPQITKTEVHLPVLIAI
jgi:hypothetical protein